MGEIVQINCSKCNCGGHFKIGAGMMSIRQDVVEKYLVKEDLQKWQELRSQDAIQFSTWKYELTYCKECKKLQSSFAVDVQIKDGERIVLGNRCSQCGHLTEPIKWERNMVCPSCQNVLEENRLTGRWD